MDVDITLLGRLLDKEGLSNVLKALACVVAARGAIDAPNPNGVRWEYFRNARRTGQQLTEMAESGLVAKNPLLKGEWQK